MKRSLRIIGNDPFPIQVTGAFPKEELQTWINNFKEKNIAIILKPYRALKKYSGKNIFTIHREATAKEIEEIKSGKVIIRGGSFREIREDEVYPGDYNYIKDIQIG